MNDRRLKFRNAKVLDDAKRGLFSPIKEIAEVSQIQFLRPLRLRDDEKVYTFLYLTSSTRYPWLVPELVTKEGKRLLITFLSFGSLLILCNMIKRFEYTITNEIV